MKLVLRTVKKLFIITCLVLVIMFIFKDVHLDVDFLVREGKLLSVSKTSGIIEGVLLCVILLFFYTGGYCLVYQPTKPVRRILGIEVPAIHLVSTLILFLLLLLLAFINLTLGAF